MRVKKLFVAAALGLVSLVLPVAAQPASAAVITERDTTTPTDMFLTERCVTVDGASGCFEHNGDYIQVYDWAADGHSAAVEWKIYNYVGGDLYRRGWCVHSGGNLTTGVCNKNFIEGYKITFRACTYESLTWNPIDCTDWTPYYTA